MTLRLLCRLQILNMESLLLLSIVIPISLPLSRRLLINNQRLITAIFNVTQRDCSSISKLSGKRSKLMTAIAMSDWLCETKFRLRKIGKILQLLRERCFQRDIKRFLDFFRFVFDQDLKVLKQMHLLKQFLGYLLALVSLLNN